MTDDVSSDLFHCCALMAYVQVAQETRQWPPDQELTRRRAFDLFERELRQSREGNG